MRLNAGCEITFDVVELTPFVLMLRPRGGRIAIAYGRDAADVALATQFGPATLTQMRVWANE